MTNGNQIDVLASRLIDGENRLVDLKFFPPIFGTDDRVTSGEICDEFLKALDQKKLGLASVSKDFNDTAKKVDVRILVVT